jgi:hypothetical protein
MQIGVLQLFTIRSLHDVTSLVLSRPTRSITELSFIITYCPSCQWPQINTSHQKLSTFNSSCSQINPVTDLSYPYSKPWRTYKMFIYKKEIGKFDDDEHT